MYALNSGKRRNVLRPAERKEVDWTKKTYVRHLPRDGVHNTNNAPEEEWYEEALVAKTNARIHYDAMVVIAQHAALTCRVHL